MMIYEGVVSNFHIIYRSQTFYIVHKFVEIQYWDKLLARDLKNL